MSRKAVYDFIKGQRGGKPWEPEEIAATDRLLAFLGIDADAPPAGGILRPSKAAFDLIKSFEGCHKRRPDGRIEAYPDPGSGGEPWTIGWGSTGPDIKRGTVWTQEMVDARFEADVIRFATGVAQAIGDAATSQNEFDACVSLAYNIGLNAFRGSTLLKKHKAGDKEEAAAQFSRWAFASGKKLLGLARRRAAEADLYKGKL